MDKANFIPGQNKGRKRKGDKRVHNAWDKEEVK
jgi:hypothetical protein